MPTSRWTPVLYDISQALELAQNPDRRVSHVMELLEAIVSYERCALVEVKGVLGRPITVLPPPEEDASALQKRLDALLALLMEDGEQTVAPGETASLCHISGHHLAVPLFSLGEVMGILFVQRAEPAYEDSHLAFLSIVAGQLGAYLSAVHSKREVQRNVARFQGLYKSDMLGIAFLSDTGRITSANRRFSRLLGRTEAQFERGAVYWHQISPPEYAEHDQCACEQTKKAGRCEPYETELLRGDGSRVPALVGAGRLGVEDDFLVVFVMDISARKRVEAARAKLLNQRELDFEFLQMFVGMLGHDLRNPLAAIMSITEVLKARDGDRLGKSLDQIMSSTERIDDMIHQVLDLTRVRLADGIPVTREHVALSDLCRQAIDEIRAGDSRGTAIELQSHGNTCGYWDSTRLLQVISNLVANAVQHAEDARGVRVQVQGQADRVVLRVNNAGTIPPELLPDLFEPFHSKAAPHHPDSLGLGLFIVKHILDAHGGSIQVESAEPEGTTFTATLPRN